LRRMAFPWGCPLARTRVLKRLEDVRDNKKKSVRFTGSIGKD